MLYHVGTKAVVVTEYIGFSGHHVHINQPRNILRLFLLP